MNGGLELIAVPLTKKIFSEFTFQFVNYKLFPGTSGWEKWG